MYLLTIWLDVSIYCIISSLCQSVSVQFTGFSFYTLLQPLLSKTHSSANVVLWQTMQTADCEFRSKGFVLRLKNDSAVQQFKDQSGMHYQTKCLLLKDICNLGPDWLQLHGHFKNMLRYDNKLCMFAWKMYCPTWRLFVFLSTTASAAWKVHDCWFTKLLPQKNVEAAWLVRYKINLGITRQQIPAKKTLCIILFSSLVSVKFHVQQNMI